jgi:galactonate dehydratase
VLRLVTDEGLYGLGETALAYGTGSVAGIGMLREMIERFVIGADPMRIQAMWQTLFRRTFWGQGGGPVVYGGISAIDEALWDIKGKALGVPVYELLGGKVNDKIRVYANGWGGRGSTSAADPAYYAEGGQRAVADGYGALKLDPFMINAQGVWEYTERALDPERADLAYARVAALREAVGPDVEICIEVHGKLGTASAIEMGRRLAEFDPFFYEEPVDAMNVDVMAQVARHVAIPIAAGERLYTRYGFREYIEKQVVDVIQPDLGLAGGISEVHKVASHAEIYGIHVQPHNYASPINTAVSVQLDAVLPNFMIQELFPYRAAEHYALVNEPLELQVLDGHLPVPEAPGLGITLDEKVIARYPCLRIAD